MNASVTASRATSLLYFVLLFTLRYARVHRVSPIPLTREAGLHFSLNSAINWSFIRAQTQSVSLPVSKATANPVRVITRERSDRKPNSCHSEERSDRRISLTVCASTGEILRFAQNDGECVYVVLLLARFFATLRMTVAAFFVGVSYFANPICYK